MSDPNGGSLRTVAWSEVFPWLIIYRTFRLAIGLRMLVLGAVAALLTALLWGFFCYVFNANLTVAEWTEQYRRCPWYAVTDNIVPDAPSLPGVPSPADVSGGGVFSQAIAPPAEALATTAARPPVIWPTHDRQPQDPFFRPWAMLSRPLWGIFIGEATLSDLACLMLCGLSSLAIWAFFGAAITRVAAVQLAADERISLFSALRYACTKWISYFSAPLFPMLGMALVAVPIVILGLLLRANLGMLVVGLIWPLLLVLGLIMTLLLVGALFGWPLMWGTISTEGTDSFDALSRSYAYVYQRPLHYLFYAAVAGLFGWFGWLLVKNFAAGIVWLTYWSASWGSGNEPVHQVLAGGGEGMGYAGAMIIRFWAGCVKLLAVGFLFSYFWTAATAIYLLLRRNVDATEMDEVYLDADESEQAAVPPAPPVEPTAPPPPPAEPPTAAKPAEPPPIPPIPPAEGRGSGITPDRPPDEAT